MKPDERQAVAHALIGLGDDELVLGHRDSEWTGHAPILEEDIAFANIALDEIGHAALWYRLAARWLDQDEETYPDQLIFARPPQAFRSVRLVELPRGDWAFTVVRQFLFDSAEAERLSALRAAPDAPWAATAAKIAVEERYHLRHAAVWMDRLGRGTDESNRRTQAALELLWSYAGQLLQPPAGDESAMADGLPDFRARLGPWESDLRRQISAWGLTPPAAPLAMGAGRDRHTEHLAPLVGEMQSVARLEAEAGW